MSWFHNLVNFLKDKIFFTIIGTGLAGIVITSVYGGSFNEAAVNQIMLGSLIGLIIDVIRFQNENQKIVHEVKEKEDKIMATLSLLEFDHDHHIPLYNYFPEEVRIVLNHYSKRISQDLFDKNEFKIKNIPKEIFVAQKGEEDKIWNVLIKKSVFYYSTALIEEETKETYLGSEGINRAINEIGSLERNLINKGYHFNDFKKFFVINRKFFTENKEDVLHVLGLWKHFEDKAKDLGARVVLLSKFDDEYPMKCEDLGIFQGILGKQDVTSKSDTTIFSLEYIENHPHKEDFLYPFTKDFSSKQEAQLAHFLSTNEAKS